LLRAVDIPARLAAVYAPGLSPMDFHAVVEADINGGWRVVDATGLAPRTALARITHGRDAADTAFVTTFGPARLLDQTISAVIVGDLPSDDGHSLAALA
jgi:transglutaminase-like putative cysteine protease